jgi:hypothetical protein
VTKVTDFKVKNMTEALRPCISVTINLARCEDLTVIAIEIIAFWLIVIDVSEKRAACILKIDDGGRTFPRKVGNDIPDPEAGGSTCLRNVGNNLPDYMASHPRRL